MPIDVARIENKDSKLSSELLQIDS